MIPFNLRAEYQQPVFIQCGFYLLIELHLGNGKTDGIRLADDNGRKCLSTFADSQLLNFHSFSNGPLAPNTGSLRGRFTVAIDLALRSCSSAPGRHSS